MWHRGDKDSVRLVLLLDLWHPWLGQDDRDRVAKAWKDRTDGPREDVTPVFNVGGLTERIRGE